MLPASSNAFGEVWEWGPAEPRRTWVCPLLPQAAASELGHGRNPLEEAFCPKHSGLQLGVGKEAGEEESISVFSWGGVILVPRERFFLVELWDCSQGWGRREQRYHKSPPGSFPGSECSYERWSRFVKPCLIVHKFDLGKKKSPKPHKPLA